MSETVDLKKWYVVRAVSGQENKIRDYGYKLCQLDIWFLKMPPLYGEDPW